MTNPIPFRYPIRSREIAKQLEEMGWIEWHASPTETVMEAPPDLSATKARKMISVVIALYKAAKELGRSQSRYEDLVNELDEMNARR